MIECDLCCLCVARGEAIDALGVTDINHAQPKADEVGVWEVGHADETGEFVSVLSINTGIYFSPEKARSVAMAILSLLSTGVATEEQK